MTDYFLQRRLYQKTFKGIIFHNVSYSLRESNFTGIKLGMCHSLDVPCRSRLHHLLTGLYYNWDWNDELEKQITEDDARMLKHIFESQKEYNLWKRALVKLEAEGSDEARSWLIEQTKVLAMRNIMREK